MKYQVQQSGFQTGTVQIVKRGGLTVNTVHCVYGSVVIAHGVMVESKLKKKIVLG